jgi:hypothetical protein
MLFVRSTTEDPHPMHRATWCHWLVVYQPWIGKDSATHFKQPILIPSTYS